MFNRVLASQQPFFQDFLNRLAAVETREAETNKILGNISTALAVIADQNLQSKIQELKSNMEQLNLLRAQWEGSVKFMSWAPRIVMWLTILVAVVVGYQTGVINVRPFPIH